MGHRKRGSRRSRQIGAAVLAAVIAAVAFVVWPSPPGAGQRLTGSDTVQAASALPSSAPNEAGGAAATGSQGSGTPSPAASSPAAASPAASATASASPKAGASTGRPGGKAAPSTPAPAPGMRQVAFSNAVAQTIWLAATPDSKHPLAATGWVLTPGQSVTVDVPSEWGGRFWGRTGCNFNGSGQGHCESGDCAGGFQCTGSGATPATLAEFALGAWGGMDFYDVSLVDGSNLPMYINLTSGGTKDPISSSGCSAGGCTKPVTCPGAMQAKAAGGKVVGCTTACSAFGTDDYCCRGAWAGRDNCVPAKWPVNYTDVFKKAEPYAYSYAYDDSATMACRGGCNYRVTFGVSGGS